jgi:hypothetical protein
LSARTSSGRVGFLDSISLIRGEQKTGLEIRVTPGAAVAVLYDGPQPYGNIRLTFAGVSVGADSMERGAHRSFSVPAGHLTAQVAMYPSTNTFDIEFDVKVGETKELTFDGAWK